MLDRRDVTDDDVVPAELLARLFRTRERVRIVVTDVVGGFDIDERGRAVAVADEVVGRVLSPAPRPVDPHRLSRQANERRSRSNRVRAARSYNDSNQTCDPVTAAQ